MQKVLISMDDVPFLIVDGGSITQWELAIIPYSTISSKVTEIDHESGSAPLTRVSIVRGTRSVRVRLATYVCVHESLHTSGHFHFTFMKTFMLEIMNT